MESIKECMSILLSSNIVFQLWESVLLRWERCNILDGSGDIPARPPKPIGKLAFGCLANLKEKQFEKLARGLLDHTITL
jgi:hypothetical protein